MCFSLANKGREWFERQTIDEGVIGNVGVRRLRLWVAMITKIMAAKRTTGGEGEMVETTVEPHVE